MEEINYDAMSPVDIGKHLLAVAERKVGAEAELKVINKKMTSINSILAKRMQDEDLSKMQVDDVMMECITDETFSLDKDVACGDWGDDQGDFFKWLKEIGEQGLIKETVHHTTRDKFLTGWREDGKSLPDFIKIGLWLHVKFSMAAIKRRVENG